ncbi:pro-Pol polyprotein [Nephila pilipes]|uniref:Pro-Pol polyprotein n=1 Tax=Nephila pilipes TaxID=299642 RepID=A0A8X6THF6_NEPPI|nr:pro-Pol polyprotein [Nephila pilipes]
MGIFQYTQIMRGNCSNYERQLNHHLLTLQVHFFYLSPLSTKIKSEARELVESFPITNENYPLAIESLTERYGRKELLIDFYVRELLKLVLSNATKKKQDSLSSLYNKLSTQLRALSSLGVTTDQCGVILYPLVESSLPTHILRSFERQRKNIDSEQSISTLDAIVSFLKSEVQSEEKIKLSRSEILPYERECKHLAESQSTLPCTAELFIQEPNDTCAFCFKVHANRFCKRAFFIPLEEKIAIIKKKGLCRVCLAKGHLASRCRSQITCQLCSKRHLKFMCPNIVCNKSDSPKQEVNDKNINEKTVDSLHSRATNEVILQTLVNVHGIKKERVMEESNLSIHTFVDASKTAYAACIFLRSESCRGSVTVQLLQARSRIAPLKTITIPRLELMAAVIGARLFSFMKQALKLPYIKTYFWTDSSTVLTWITRREQWSVFVTNRISEIRKLTTSEDWLHISTDQNPADILSRGCGPKQLQKCKWWQGPAWLQNPKEQWPKSAVNIDAELESISLQLARRFSRFSKMIRVMAWVLRFQLKAKDLRKYAELTNEELLNAQKIIFRVVQKECYSNEETRKNLRGLQVFEDEEGILRLKSRLINEEESKYFISPIILPSKHLAMIKKRMHWLLGRVLELFPGKDGIIRLVKLRTEKGNVLRPIQRLYPLELKPNYEQVVSENRKW